MTLLGGRDNVEHRDVLKIVVQQVKDLGITFNREQCQFGKE